MARYYGFSTNLPVGVMITWEIFAKRVFTVMFMLGNSSNPGTDSVKKRLLVESFTGDKGGTSFGVMVLLNSPFSLIALHED
jgi:hypothetical protein